MTRCNSRSFVEACALILAMSMLIGCESGEASDARPATQPADAKSSSEMLRDQPNIEHPPVATFSAGCARCHGPQGMFYGAGFGDLDDEHLKETIHEMMEGPAELHPTEADVDAMTAYHHALRADEPFGCITNAADFLDDKADHLQGEVSTNARIEIVSDSQQDAVTQDGTSWLTTQEVTLPVRFRVIQDKQQVEFEFPRQLTTHSK